MTPTEELKKEHEAIRAMPGILERLCTKLESGGQVNSVHLEHIVELLKVFAEVHLSEDQQRQLSAGFEKIETERVGAGMHGEFHQHLHNLKGVYFQ